METTTPQPDSPIVARAGRYYRNTRYIMGVVLIAMGLWFGYDGFKGWPEENRKVEQLESDLAKAQAAGDDERRAELANELKNYKHHSELDILIQRVLCFTLPPLGLALLGWTIYNSRGAYRLEGTQLSVPGHPTIDLNDITLIDKKLWDRKGIAYLAYDIGGQQGKIKLDDFVYDALPTRAIFDAAENNVLARAGGSSDEPTSEAPTTLDT